MTRVFVVASTLAMRAGLHALLNTASAIEVVGEAASLLEAKHALPAIDVLVMTGDVLRSNSQGRLLTGLEILPAVLILSDEATGTQDFIRLGWRAWGLLPVDASPEELAAAVQALQEGLVAGPFAMLAAALNQNHLEQELERLPGETLTARELEVLQLLAQGLANKQISLSLGISEHTVKFHVSSLYMKLGASNRTEAVRKGFQRGLVTL